MILNSKLFQDSGLGEDHLVQLFSGVRASPQSKVDLLSFRKVGERLLLKFVTHGIL
jgi:hypothetical protein